MKQGWTYKKLGEVCDIIGGGTPDTKIKEYWKGNIPWATVSDMNCDELKSTGYYITDKGLKESSSRIIKSGEIIIATRVGLGKVCKLVVDTAINQDLKGVIPKNNNILRDFIFYYFKKNAKYIVDNGVGATVKGVKIKFIEGLSFGYPPLSEQKHIVSRLDTAFAHIDALKANAEKQLSEARTLFQKALEEAMKPKEGWEEKTLKEIGTTQTGTTPSKGDSSNYGDYIPFIRPSEIDYDGRGSILYDSEMKLSEKGLSNGRLFRSGSILMVCIGATIGKVGYCTHDVSCNQQINVLTPKDGFDFKFLYYAMRNKAFIAKVIKEGTSAQATLPIINKGKWEKLTIAYPSLADQQHIVSRLDSLSEHVKQLEATQRQVIAECDALKQAMLRKVFE